MSHGIFISYRRDDTSGFAGRLFDRLAEVFSREQVFIDIQGIEPGANFANVLNQQLDYCDVLLVLIGERWLTAASDGRGRLSDPKDFVRMEIEAALARDVRVIPLLIDGARMPAAKELPDSIQSLSLRQTVEISHKRFEADVGILLQALRRSAKPLPQAVGSDTDTDKPLPLPDKPSVAVLPFQNMSGDPEQEYFADGVVEDIITALSRVKSFFVIARNSSFTFKGRAVDIRQVGRDLGVRYVLMGSVRKAGARLRITGQLLEAATGHHVWADRFDGELEDLFELQDQIAASVVAAIEPSLLSAELHRIRSKPTDSLSAYDLYLRSLPYIHAFTDAGLLNAEELLRGALGLDARYADAWAALADCVARQTFNGIIENWGQGTEIACNAALKAVEIDPENGSSVSICAWNLSAFGRKHDEAVELASRALKLHPNSAYVQTNCGWAFTYNGEFDRALTCFDAARRMNPLDPRGYLNFNGISMTHLIANNFQEAERWTRRALDQRRSFPASLRIRAASLAHLGRIPEAKDLIAELLLIQPNSTVKRTSQLGIRDRDQLATYLDGLRLAGLPE